MQKEVYEHISKQTNDPIVERRECEKSWKEFAIFQSDLEFLDKVSPRFNWEKCQISMPKLCPDERLKRRLMFRNERKLYKRKCDFSQKNIVSIYAPDSIYKVYDQKIWRSDQRDPTEYWREFDFTKTFKEQFGDLLEDVPKCNLITDYNELENSDYVHLAWPSKNCYLCVETDRCESSLYSYIIYDSHYCVDCNNVYSCENCYECVDINKCYNAHYCLNCHSCKDIIACVDCKNISNCFGCRNLQWGKYMIFNKQYDKETYFSKIKSATQKHKQVALQKAKNSAIYKHFVTTNNSGNISWSQITNSENTMFSYDLDSCRDCKYCNIAHHANDCADYFSRWENSSIVYEAHNSWANLSNSCFCNFVWHNCNNIVLSDLCTTNNQYLLACVGMRNKKYCILNKQYTQGEYEILAPKIIKHLMQTWERWEFFDGALSPFWYNETVAQEYFPLTKEEALKENYKWMDKEYPVNVPEGTATIEAWELSDNISDVDDTILNKAIICEVSWKLYRITNQELKFHRQHDLSLPKKHPDIRHHDRINQRPSRELHLRQCDNCTKEILSVYPKDSDLKIYCESCYNQAIY